MNGYNYNRLSEYLGGKDNRPAPEIANNTRIVNQGEYIGVKLHDTDVLAFYPDGRVTLNSGGWRTVTTKERFNTYLPSPWRVYQERGQWWVTDSWDNPGVVYADGLTIGPDGNVTGVGVDLGDLSRRIAKYAKSYAAAFVAGDVPAPGPGDCFYCSMVTTDGESLGDVMGGTDHLLSHLNESYFVPSLLTLAINDGGRFCTLSQHYIGSTWAGEKEDSQWLTEIAARDIKSAIARYLKRRLGVAA